MEATRLASVAGRGIEGDRYFDLQPDYKGQITCFDAAVLQALGRRFRTEVRPSVLRRNVVLAGIDPNDLIGCDFRLQGVWFRGVEEYRPCYWMDHAVAPGAEAFLRGRGGLRARILTGGRLRSGPATLTY
jgi:MOSC domain-containing protein YiiM